MSPVMFAREQESLLERSEPSCWLEPETLAVPAGQTSWMALHLSSTGRRPALFRLWLEAPRNWRFESPVTAVEVDAGDEGILFLAVSAPDSARVGTRHPLQVRVHTASRMERVLRVMAHVVPAEPKHDLRD